MSSRAAPPRPGCCELGERNLVWFPRSKPSGAWHAVTPLRRAERDEPVSEPLLGCPFCGKRLDPPSPAAGR